MSDGTRPTLDPHATTVHEALRRVPGAGETFRRFGLDTCCGGELPVAVAAERHGVPLDRLLDALGSTDADDASGPAEGDAGGASGPAGRDAEA